MDKYQEFLLNRIFEIKQSKEQGDLGDDAYYENMVGELLSCLSQYTVMSENNQLM